MNKTPTDFTRDSDAAVYGRDAENGRRSLGEVARRAMMAGMAVAMSVSLMAPAARAEAAPAENPSIASVTMDAMQKVNRLHVQARAGRLAAEGVAACYVVKVVQVTGPTRDGSHWNHTDQGRDFQGDVTSFAKIGVDDCLAEARLTGWTGPRALPMDRMPERMRHDPSVETYEAATAKQEEMNSHLVEQAMLPMAPR